MCGLTGDIYQTVCCSPEVESGRAIRCLFSFQPVETSYSGLLGAIGKEQLLNNSCLHQSILAFLGQLKNR